MYSNQSSQGDYIIERDHENNRQNSPCDVEIVKKRTLNNGPGEMAQDGGTRGGTFHGEIDRCRKSLG